MRVNPLHAVLSVVLLAAASASAQPTKLKLTLDWKFGGETAPFVMAKAKGYYDQEGLDVQIDAGNGSAAPPSNCKFRRSALFFE